MRPGSGLENRQEPPVTGSLGLDLSIVMPVYNEGAVIADVVSAWCRTFERLEINHECRVYDDGSTDDTASALDDLAAAHPGVVVTHQANAGHGPTILRGYREARGQWVFQIDSDDEMGTDAFQEFWSRRDQYDFLVARRDGRQSPLARHLISAFSRLTVRLAFGRSVWDVNCPYRLMRRDPLMRLLTRVPEGTFAPNVILTGLAAQAGLRLGELPVPHRGRKTGKVSLFGLGAWKAAWRCFRETVSVAMTKTH
jgi:dolichol-phosphate mannosyltransferase